MSLLDEVRNLDWQDPKTLAIVGGGTAAVVGYMALSSRRGKGTPDAGATAARELEPPANVDAGRDGIPGWVGFPEWPLNPNTPTPTQPAPVDPTPTPETGPCPAGKVATYSGGALRCFDPASGAYASQKCPPGYVAVASSHGSRCVQVDDKFKSAEGPTSYIPTDLKGTYEKGFRGITAAAAGEAFLRAGSGFGAVAEPASIGGEAFRPISGAVRSFSPVARPIVAQAGNGYTVGENDTLASIARRVYGNAGFWPRLAERNGARAANLRAGDRLRV